MIDLPSMINAPLPQNPEAERAVLGAILTNSSNYWRIVGIVSEEHFFKDAHRAIFRAIASLAEEHGQEIDSLTVRHALVSMRLLDAAGGHAYVASLTDGIPDMGNVERYARIVREQSELRHILTACNAGMRRVLSDPGDGAASIASEVAATLRGTSVDARSESMPIHDAVRDVEARIASRRVEGRTRAIRLGFPSLDLDRIARRKALTVIGAPTSHGKTTFMLNGAVGAVRADSSIRAAIYSLEMSDEDMTEPIESMMTGIPMDRLQARERGYELSEMDEFKLRGALEEMRQWKQGDRLFFADRIRDIATLRADCMRRKSQSGLDIIFVDYLQLVRGFDERTREQDVDRISRALTIDIAQDLDIAVVTGSQVNKEWERRPTGRLSVMDLKHGAVIGEYASVVCLFQRPRQSDKVATDANGNAIPWCQTNFQVEKNRGRKTSDVPMHANMSIQTFTEGDCEANGCGVRGQGRLV